MIDLKTKEKMIRDFSSWQENNQTSSSESVEAGAQSAPAAQKKLFDPSKIVGSSEVHDACRQMIRDLEAWKKGELAWSDITASAVIEGPPGCGKTHLARQMGEALGKNKIVITSYADWQAAGHMGDFLKAMKKSFSDAKRNAPSILFIDEIDSFGTRNSGGRNDSYDTKAINGFLAELDMSQLEGVIVVAACNDKSNIDPAILRDGRFDESFTMDLPGISDIEIMLSKPLDQLATAEDIAQTARMLVGVPPAEIHGTIRKLKSECRRKDKPFSTAELLERVLPPKDRQEAIWRRVAAHEAGHAIVCKALNLGKVTRVLMRSNGSGFAQSMPMMNEQTTMDYEARIAHLMAGRSAEQLICSSVSAGAGGSDQSDMAKATRIALMLETSCALGSSGYVYAKLKDEDWMGMEIANRVSTRIHHGTVVAKRVLEENLDCLREMTAVLVRERILEGEALDALLENVIPMSKHVAPSVPIQTSKSLFERITESSLVFSRDGKKQKAIDLAASYNFLTTLCVIGWRYGERKRRYSEPCYLTACAQGLQFVEGVYPAGVIIKFKPLMEWADSLRLEDGMSNMKDIANSREARFVLKDVIEHSKDAAARIEALSPEA